MAHRIRLRPSDAVVSVYVDGANIRADVPNSAHVVRGVWCHMTADSRAELDAMADRIGLRRSWVQHPGCWHEHYDLTKSKRRLAVAAGAVEVDGMEHTATFLASRRCRPTGEHCLLQTGHAGPHRPGSLR